MVEFDSLDRLAPGEGLRNLCQPAVLGEAELVPAVKPEFRFFGFMARSWLKHSFRTRSPFFQRPVKVGNRRTFGEFNQKAAFESAVRAVYEFGRGLFPGEVFSALLGGGTAGYGKDRQTCRNNSGEKIIHLHKKDDDV